MFINELLQVFFPDASMLYVITKVGDDLNTFLAYIDPGIGSMLFQILIASFVGTAFVVKMFWKNIISFFRKNKEKEEA